MQFIAGMLAAIALLYAGAFVYGVIQARRQRSAAAFDRYLSAFGLSPRALPSIVKEELLALFSEEEAFMEKHNITLGRTTAGTTREETMIKVGSALIVFLLTPQAFASRHPTWVDVVSRSADDPKGIDARVIAVLAKHGLTTHQPTSQANA
jgi:hypothetical protein